MSDCERLTAEQVEQDYYHPILSARSLRRMREDPRCVGPAYEIVNGVAMYRRDDVEEWITAWGRR